MRLRVCSIYILLHLVHLPFWMFDIWQHNIQRLKLKKHTCDCYTTSHILVHSIDPFNLILHFQKKHQTHYPNWVDSNLPSLWHSAFHIQDLHSHQEELIVQISQALLDTYWIGYIVGTSWRKIQWSNGRLQAAVRDTIEKRKKVNVVIDWKGSNGRRDGSHGGVGRRWEI